MTTHRASESTTNIRAATPGDAAAIAKVQVASWHETYAGLIPDAMLAALSVDERTTRWARILGAASDPLGSSVFVAERAGEVVGFASCGPQRDEALRARGFPGEISAIYVLQGAQNAGTGRRLMRAAARSLHDRGCHAASLWVLRDNQPARSFYERLGGAVIGEKEDHRDGATLVELAYGWRDLAGMAGT